MLDVAAWFFFFLHFTPADLPTESKVTWFAFVLAAEEVSDWAMQPLCLLLSQPGK